MCFSNTLSPTPKENRYLYKNCCPLILMQFVYVVRELSQEINREDNKNNIQNSSQNKSIKKYLLGLPTL